MDSTLWTGLFPITGCLVSSYYHCFIEISLFNAYSGDTDQTPHSAVSDLGLHCLPFILFGVPRLKIPPQDAFLLQVFFFRLFVLLSIKYTPYNLRHNYNGDTYFRQKLVFGNLVQWIMILWNSEHSLRTPNSLLYGLSESHWIFRHPENLCLYFETLIV